MVGEGVVAGWLVIIEFKAKALDFNLGFGNSPDKVV